MSARQLNRACYAAAQQWAQSQDTVPVPVALEPGGLGAGRGQTRAPKDSWARNAAARLSKKACRGDGSLKTTATKATGFRKIEVPQAIPDYNNKFIEFAQANTNAAFDFIQKLSAVKSPRRS
jgi:hypothetical protein